MFDFLNGLDPAMTDLHSKFSEGMAEKAGRHGSLGCPGCQVQRQFGTKAVCQDVSCGPDFLDEDLGESPGFLRRHQKSQAKPMGTSGMPWNGGTRRIPWQAG